jgi:hypothetical protein
VPTERCDPVARSAYEPRRIQAVKLQQTTWLIWVLPRDFGSERPRHARFVRGRHLVGVTDDDRICLAAALRPTTDLVVRRALRTVSSSAPAHAVSSTPVRRRSLDGHKSQSVARLLVAADS